MDKAGRLTDLDLKTIAWLTIGVCPHTARACNPNRQTLFLGHGINSENRRRLSSRKNSQALVTLNSCAVVTLLNRGIPSETVYKLRSRRAVDLDSHRSSF
jgi:hypothetical protein